MTQIGEYGQNNMTRRTGLQRQAYMKDIYGDPRSFQGGLLDVFNQQGEMAADPQAYHRKLAQQQMGFSSWNPFGRPSGGGGEASGGGKVGYMPQPMNLGGENLW